MTRRPVNSVRLSPLRRGLVLGFLRAKRQARKTDARHGRRLRCRACPRCSTSFMRSRSRFIANATPAPSMSRSWSAARIHSGCYIELRPNGTVPRYGNSRIRMRYALGWRRTRVTERRSAVMDPGESESESRSRSLAAALRKGPE